MFYFCQGLLIMKTRSEIKSIPIIFVVLFMLQSCNKEIPETQEYYSMKLDGTYDLISLEAHSVVDLDMDQNYSVDIIKETHQEASISKYFVELTTEIKYWEPIFYNQNIYLWAPYPNVFSDEDGNYLYTDYGFTGIAAKYRYYEETNDIEIFDNWGEGEILSAKVEGDTLLTITFKQMHYTIDGWGSITMDGRYNRRM